MLHIRKALNDSPGIRLPLDGERFVIGRDSKQCAFVIPNSSVSRTHCHLVRVEGQWFVEDLGSRNKTLLNNQALTPNVPVQLKHDDRIRICDLFLAVFETEDLWGYDSKSVVRAELAAAGRSALESQPAEKLRALLEASASLSRALELDALLAQVGDCLFELFRQAEHAFLLLVDEESGKVEPRVIRVRQIEDLERARYSRRLARRCLETGQAMLWDDAGLGDDLTVNINKASAQVRSAMTAPLMSLGPRVFGVLQVDTLDATRKFSPADLQLLCGVASLAAISLENRRLAHEAQREAALQQRLRDDLERARAVLLGCLPEKLPEMPGYRFAAHYCPADLVGGDYYDFLPLNDSRLAVVVGDVAGKGMSAALLVTKMASEAPFSFLREPTLGKALDSLNEAAAAMLIRTSRFVTLAAAVLDSHTHEVTLANAGHPSPLLLRAATVDVEECVPRDVAGLPLGVESQPFQQCTIRLEPGDALLMYSDGIPDTVDGEGKRMGMEPVLQALRDGGPADPASLAQRVLEVISRHAAGAAPYDDVTLVILAREPLS
jgi:serine phosphatase RsbU (regulator of sigma subunit)